MNHSQKEENNGFPARFGQFLKAEKITAGRLATIMTPEGEDPKKNRVKYGRWLSGEASPSYEGVVEIAVRYGLNMNWLMLGHGPMLEQDIDATNTSVASSASKPNLVDNEPDWKAMYLDVVKRLNVLQEKYDKIVDAVLSKMSFPSTSSYSPVEVPTRMWIRGLRSSQVQEFSQPEGKVIPMYPQGLPIEIESAQTA